MQRETVARNAGLEAASRWDGEWSVSVEVPGTWIDRSVSEIDDLEDEDPDWWAETWTVERWKAEVLKAMRESGRVL